MTKKFTAEQLIQWLLEVKSVKEAVNISPNTLYGKTMFFMDKAKKDFTKANKSLKFGEPRFHLDPWNHHNDGNPLKFFLSVDENFLDDCVLTKRDKVRFISHEMFEMRARAVHGNKYDYSLVPKLVVVDNK